MCRIHVGMGMRIKVQNTCWNGNENGNGKVQDYNQRKTHYI